GGALEGTGARASVRARYGERPYRVINQECNVVRYHEVPHPGRALLQARRLVEAGVSVVTVAFHDWDTHRYNFTTLRQLLPPLDQAVSALVTDLDERGLLGDVAVLMGGEFGRTPRIGDITPDGRSHWPEAGFLWVAGGGLQTGPVIRRAPRPPRRGRPRPPHPDGQRPGHAVPRPGHRPRRYLSRLQRPAPVRARGPRARGRAALASPFAERKATLFSRKTATKAAPRGT